jgi:hypothetical protein
LAQTVGEPVVAPPLELMPPVEDAPAPVPVPVAPAVEEPAAVLDPAALVEELPLPEPELAAEVEAPEEDPPVDPLLELEGVEPQAQTAIALIPAQTIHRIASLPGEELAVTSRKMPVKMVAVHRKVQQISGSRMGQRANLLSDQPVHVPLTQVWFTWQT